MKKLLIGLALTGLMFHIVTADDKIDSSNTQTVKVKDLELIRK